MYVWIVSHNNIIMKRGEVTISTMLSECTCAVQIVEFTNTYTYNITYVYIDVIKHKEIEKIIVTEKK